MPSFEPKPSGLPELDSEEQLRKEVEKLKRQLEAQKSHGASPHKPWNPSPLTIGVIFLLLTIAIVAAFLTGYIPLQRQRSLIQAEAREEQDTLPRVDVIEVVRSDRDSQLELPGNIQAVTEAPILARADGYVRRRLVDIGDRVKAGQPVAEIDAPEVDQQLRQAKATVQQAQAALDQALANLEQGKSNMELARVTAQRWSSLVAQGVVSKQENDQYQAQYVSQAASVQSLEKAIAAQRSNLAAAEANVSRLDEVQGYRVVKAPFDGVITLRNVDVGALVNSGNTLLFRIAQTATLRIYVSVPQSNTSSVKVGQIARVSVSNLPGRMFVGKVARTAHALDPATRTLLVEVELPNAEGLLLPGMYAEVDLSESRPTAPLLISADSLMSRAEGTMVAVVGPDHIVHLQKIEIGRDLGDRLEVIGGLHDHDQIIANPGDIAREGVKVNPVLKGK